jgi:hypothetical protein
MPIDPAHWSWPRVLTMAVVWAGAVTLIALALLTRAMERAKETQAAGGDFVTVLPYGTRHLTIALVVALVPPLLAALRKVLAG